MPLQEWNDFCVYWRESLIDPVTDLPRPAGGSEHVVDGVRGVDYSAQLIPWCKGNSVSVDQNTLQLYRTLMSILFENYRTRLRWVDARPKVNEIDSRAGLTSEDVTRMYGSHVTKRNRRHAAGEPTRNWTNAEFLFIYLLQGRHIRLYSSHNTINREEQRIIQDIEMGKHGEPGWMQHGICAQLLGTRDSGGHVRLALDFGWETYIRDHYGAPSGIDGVIAGSLQAGVDSSLERTMEYPLHIVLSETLARAHGHGNQRNEWGKNQSRIRREIADLAIGGDGDRIALDDYYLIFANNSAAHMADSFFHRSVSDKSAARYELEEVVGSNPKRWNVLLEPEFVRWREIQRERER